MTNFFHFHCRTLIFFSELFNETDTNLYIFANSWIHYVHRPHHFSNIFRWKIMTPKNFKLGEYITYKASSFFQHFVERLWRLKNLQIHVLFPLCTNNVLHPAFILYLSLILSVYRPYSRSFYSSVKWIGWREEKTKKPFQRWLFYQGAAI